MTKAQPSDRVCDVLTDTEAEMLMDNLHAIRRAPTAPLRAEALKAGAELVYTFAGWGHVHD